MSMEQVLIKVEVVHRGNFHNSCDSSMNGVVVMRRSRGLAGCHSSMPFAPVVHACLPVPEPSLRFLN